MQNINVVAASENDSEEVSRFVKKLLIELEPGAIDEIKSMHLAQVARVLLSSSKIWAFLAKHDEQTVGGITLHECAAIYAGGVFGEISELYVNPEYRSSNIGALLLRSAVEKGRELGWKRLEVGSPPSDESPRTIKFYEGHGFKYTGPRLRCLIEKAP